MNPISSKHKIFFIIGASGSGKTTTLKNFEKSIPEGCILLHFDSIGVPSFEKMEREYGSIEEWQRIKTLDWVKKIAEENLFSSNVIFDAQIRPSFIKEACDLYEIDYKIVLFDCSDRERKKRLIARGHPELADENMMNWAAFLRKQCQKHHHKIINNTHITMDQTLRLLNEWLSNQLDTQLEIPIEIAKELISTQFPEYVNLPIKTIEPNGWDNRTFRLGNQMSIRLPSAERYAEKVPIEHKWLPKLGAKLSIPIPQPIAIGEPNKNYPWKWSIYKWIEGQNANFVNLDDKALESLAGQLADFLNELQAIDPSDGPLPGKHNFFRGDSPIIYDAETRSAIDNLEAYIDTAKAISVWELAISSRWDKKPVWIHGDFSAANILIKNNRLAGVIDFGGIAIGDPSCDLVIAWTFLRGASRNKFKSALQLYRNDLKNREYAKEAPRFSSKLADAEAAKLKKFSDAGGTKIGGCPTQAETDSSSHFGIDENTWNRAKGWALWKALITLEAIADKTSLKAQEQLHIIKDILKEKIE